MNTCVICGKDTAREVSSARTVHLLGRAESFARREFKCTSCGETFTNDSQGLANERAERAATCRALREIGAGELKKLRDLMHVTQIELENALGLGRNTVARWETGARPLPPYIKSMIRLLAINPTTLTFLKDQNLPEDELVIDSAFTGTIPPVKHVEYRAPLRRTPRPPSPSSPPPTDPWGVIQHRFDPPRAKDWATRKVLS